MNFVSARRGSRPFAAGALTAAAFALILVLAFAARAQASETLYWNNYGANPDNIAFADIGGSGGGLVNTGGQAIEDPEGMAYDTATNRLFVTTGNGSDRHILAIDLAGGSSPFTAPGAPVEEPEGVAIDPVARIIYWQNTRKDHQAIVWAKLDGSTGGVLSSAGITLDGICCRLAVDPAGGRVYFVNFHPEHPTIAYVNTNNTGGGELSTAGATFDPDGEGIAVDSSAGRVYFFGGTDELGYANTSGSGGGDVSTAGAPVEGPWGLAVDQSISRIYWGNESNGEERTNAFGFIGSNGLGAGGISIATAPVANPQDPLIIKSPVGTGAPVISRNPAVPAELACSTGSWGADYAGSFVYQAPRSFAYQWSLNGTALGSGPDRITASAAGSYTCTVTATNQSGSASQTSAAGTTVTATNVKLTTKPRKAKAKPGKAAKFKVTALNQGDIQTSSNAKVCVKVPKKAKKALKAPKCKALGVVGGLSTKVTKLKVKVKPTAAPGNYKVTLQVKGAAGKAVKATVKVIG